MATSTEEVVADEQEPKERSIREEIEAARDEINARGNQSDDESIAQRSDSMGSGGTSEPSESSSERSRDASGRFTGSREVAGNAKDGSTVGDHGSLSKGPSGNSGPAENSVGLVPLPPPQSWNAEEKKLWAQLPASAQQIVTRREQEAHRRITEQDEVRSVGNHFMQAANEFAPVIQARGGNPVALFREFLGIVHQIHNADPANRANIFRSLAAQNGVDLRGLGVNPQPGAQPQGQPPNVPIDTLVQRAVDERFQARQRHEAQERERVEMESTDREIQAFRSKVDANGQPAYPYFDHVTGLMASILGGEVATTLEEAYQLAVKAHPETSKLIEQSAQAAAKAAEEKRQRAQAARRKAGSIPPGVGNSPAANGAGNRSIRDELKAAWEEHRGRI